VHCGRAGVPHIGYLGSMSGVPIILRPSVWERSPLERLQALPKSGKPVTLKTEQFAVEFTQDYAAPRGVGCLANSCCRCLR
jgi:hypothetical protein